MSPLVENAIGGLIAAALAGGGALIFQRWRSRRINVRRLHHRDDEDAKQMLSLYSELFPPDGSNYTEDEIAQFLPNDDDSTDVRHVYGDDIFLAAKIQGNVIGFLWSCYYPVHRMAIIPYYGVIPSLKGAIRLRVGPCMVRRLMKVLQKRTDKCKRIVFEVQKPSASMNAQQRRDRVALVRLFKSLGRDIHLPVTEVLFDYKRPRLSGDDPFAFEEDLVLMLVDIDCVTSTGKPPQKLQKQELAAILKFLYMDCYGDVYPVDDPRHPEFQAYLKSRFNEVSETLPAEIPLRI